MARWFAFFIAIGLGLAAGLYYGWAINPVEYVDTTPDTLRSDFRTDYVLMVAEIYQAEQDLEFAARQLAVLGAEPPSEIVRRTLAFAVEFGYGESDLAALEGLRADLQTWNPPAENLAP